MQEALHERVLTLEEALAALEAVSADDIQALAGRLFQDAGLSARRRRPARHEGARPRTGPPPAMNEAAVTTRMAHLHLRTGLPALARVELETLAGHGELGAPALADLAEARWRGGDLSGAAEAARAHLDQGGDQVLAEVVIIESLAAAGDHRDARRLAQRVLARADVDGATLDRVFAGHPRSSAWPGRRESDTSLAIAALTTGARGGLWAGAGPCGRCGTCTRCSCRATRRARRRDRGPPQRRPRRR